MRLYDYAASGNCYKARLLLALLDLPYERVAVDIFAGDTLTEEYAAINPARETPVLELDDGTRLAQSNAILWYVAEGTPLLPRTTLERARVVQWLMFEQEYVISGIAAPRFWLMTGRGDEGAIASRQTRGREALHVGCRASRLNRGSSTILCPTLRTPSQPSAARSTTDPIVLACDASLRASRKRSDPVGLPRLTS